MKNTHAVILLNKDGIPVRQNPYNQENLIWDMDELSSNTLNSYDFGLVPSQGYIVLDIDNQYESDLMFQYLETLGVKFNCMQTTRGKHFWFRYNGDIPNWVGVKNGLGIKCDIRLGGKKCFLRIKKNGVCRQWIKHCGSWDLDYIPMELLPSKTFNNFDFTGQEEGRNLTIYKLISAYHRERYTTEVKERVIDFVNDYMCYEPIDEIELNHIKKSNKDFDNDSIYQNEFTETYLGDGGLIYKITYTWDKTKNIRKILKMETFLEN